MIRNSMILGKGDEWMRQKKRIWWTFQLWEADAFQQYLEEMAQQGWFLESVGGSVMKFYQAQPEKRRYVALLVPESSSLTGTDIAKAEQFREQCQEAGWNFQCSGNMLSAVLLVGISLFARNWIQNHSSGNSGDDWLSYLVAVAVLAMIIVPLRNAITAHFQEEETDSGKKQTIFASCQTSDFQMSGSGKSVGVTIYTSPIPWIIQKTSKCYPKDLTKYWNQVEQELPAELTELPDGIEVSWYRYLINDDDPAVDEVILKDRGRLVVLDYGGGTDLEGVEEAVEAFRGGAICVK